MSMGHRRFSVLRSLVGPLMTVAFLVMVTAYLWMQSDRPDTSDLPALLKYANEMELAGNVYSASFFLFCALVVAAIYLLTKSRK